MIEVQNAGVSLGGKEILHGINFEAKPGEITTVIGPNGSGKSTLFRAMTGDVAYRGSIQLLQREVAQMQPWEMAAMRAVLPQSSALSFPFTVGEVVRFGLTTGRSGSRPTDHGHQIQQALETVDLSGFAGRFYQELSGGEQQRVQLARVLCQVWEPKLDGVARFLFLDEPVSSLDIRHQLIIMDVAQGFAKAGGGVVVILHDLNLAAMYSDRILVLQNGRAVGFDTPSQVICDDILQRVFECRLKVGDVPSTDSLFVLPQSAA